MDPISTLEKVTRQNSEVGSLDPLINEYESLVAVKEIDFPKLKQSLKNRGRQLLGGHQQLRRSTILHDTLPAEDSILSQKREKRKG